MKKNVHPLKPGCTPTVLLLHPPQKNIKLPSLQLDIYSNIYILYMLYKGVLFRKNPSFKQRLAPLPGRPGTNGTKQHVSRASSPLFALIPAKEFQCVTFPGP